ncbi:response regulator [Candidatus Dependentiae bacterium]|nr:response regulator [Candidatus Dependentiae bacterium]
MKVLIIDDSPIARFELKSMLQNVGFENFYEAENGDEGFELAKNIKPEIISLDILMPGTDGVEILKKLRKELPDSKVIMISALGKQHTLVECLKIGAVNFIGKPYLTEQVEEVFGYYLNLK